RRRHTRLQGDWSSDVCSSDLFAVLLAGPSLRSCPLLPQLAGRPTSLPPGSPLGVEQGDGLPRAEHIARGGVLLEEGPQDGLGARSEERRVGKEGGDRASG